MGEIVEKKDGNVVEVPISEKTYYSSEAEIADAFVRTVTQTMATVLDDREEEAEGRNNFLEALQETMVVVIQEKAKEKGSTVNEADLLAPLTSAVANAKIQSVETDQEVADMQTHMAKYGSNE